jgi:hypothetical protein
VVPYQFAIIVAKALVCLLGEEGTTLRIPAPNLDVCEVLSHFVVVLLCEFRRENMLVDIDVYRATLVAAVNRKQADVGKAVAERFGSAVNTPYMVMT